MKKRIIFSVGINAVEALGTVTRMIAIANEVRKIAPDTHILFRAAGSEAEHVTQHAFSCVSGYKPEKFGFPAWIWTLIGRVQGEWSGVIPAIKNMESIIRYPNTRLHRSYNRLLQRLKLPEVSNILDIYKGYGCAERLIPSIPEMEDVPDADKNHFVGSIVPEKFSATSWTWEKKRHVIYVYLSIGQISPQLAERVLTEAFAESDFDVVFSGAGHPYFENKEEFQHGQVHFFRYTPADEVLRQADIAIHHGGQNTTLQCIESQVPALIFPGEHFERYYNAKKAAELGCAYNLKNEEFTTDQLRSYCHTLIDGQDFRYNLEKFSQRIHALGGRRKAAEMILESR